MQYLRTFCRWGSAALGALIGLLGGWDPLLSVLCAFVALDYCTGVLAAWRGRSPKTDGGGLSSRAGFDGLLRKGMIFVVVAMAALLDGIIDGGSAMFRTASVCFYIANEGVSVLENAALLGAPIPDAVRRALEVCRRKGDASEE